MVSRKAKGKHRLDKFYHLAKEQGYRSRAAFKLIQLNRKYQFLSDCRAVLDLCAAPGGWLQVVAKNVPVSSLVFGVDLVPIKAIRGVKTAVADITTDKCRAIIKKESAGNHFDVVLHDGAPNVGGAWASEALSQAILVLDSLKLATEFLAPKGWFVTKVFRSKDYNALLYAFNQLFDKVEATKPSASRGTSAEIFVVCQGYKAPEKIDPRLLDSRFLFQDMVAPPKTGGPAALLKQLGKKQRNRDGYAEGVSTTHKRTSALAFIQSPEPVEMLGQYTQFVFEGSSAADGAREVNGQEPAVLTEKLSSAVASTPEIKQLCGDLLVIGRRDFKSLLKWRLEMRKALDLEHKKVEKKEQEEEDPEAKLLREMKEIKERMEHRNKKDRKRRKAIKRKSKMKLAMMMEEGAAQDGLDDEGLFSLSALKTVKDLDRVKESEAMGVEQLNELADSESGSDSDGSEGDSDEDQMKYEMLVDEYLESSYAKYMEKRGEKVPVVMKRKRRRLDEDGELSGGSSEGDCEVDNEDYGIMFGNELNGEEKVEGGGLLVDLDEARVGVPKTPAAVSAQWFAQDIFKGLMGGDENGDNGEEDGVNEGNEVKETVEVGGGSGIGCLKKNGVANAVEDDADDELEEISDDDDDLEEQADEGGESDSDYGDIEADAANGPDTNNTGEFEVVPQGKEGSDKSGTDTEDEFRMLDDDGKAEVLALAKRFLKRKDKENIIDAAYNRYAFHDPGQLPKWFRDDERRFMRPGRQVTRAEMEEQKALIRAIDSRPIKKVAEAKARKRKRLTARLKAAQKKAENIAGQEDMSMGSRMREIERVYAKARTAEDKFKKGKKKKVTRREARKPKGPPLDDRLRSDRRFKGQGRNGKNRKKVNERKSLERAKKKARRK